MNITADPRNARVHTQRNRDAVRISLEQLGAGRAPVIDAENIGIGGNTVIEEAEILGIPVRIIETDGSELVVVKRTDLHSDDPKRKALAVADNRTSDLSTFDDQKLVEMLDECENLKYAAGFSTEELDGLKSLNSLFSDLNGESSFANSVKAAADVFSVTFVFSKNLGSCVTDFIRQKGKKALTDHIVAFCSAGSEAANA